MASSFIPAYPGFSMIYISEDETDAWVSGPIIGWHIESRERTSGGGIFYMVWPVTLDAVAGKDTQEFAVLRPDGTIESPSGTFEDMAALLADLKKHRP